MIPNKHQYINLNTFSTSSKKNKDLFNYFKFTSYQDFPFRFFIFSVIKKYIIPSKKCQAVYKKILVIYSKM